MGDVRLESRQRAFQVKAPLKEIGMTKAEIRAFQLSVGFHQKSHRWPVWVLESRMESASPQPSFHN